MSILFDANGENINHGSGSSIDDLPNAGTCTWLGWVYMTGSIDNLHVFTMDGPTFGTRAGLLLLLDGTTGDIRAIVRRATTDADYVTNSAPIAASTWTFVAVVYDASAGAGEIINVYTGDLSTIATEESYGTATDGSGTATADASNNKWIGNLQRADTFEFDGRIARFGYYSNAMTLKEVQMLQFAPTRTWNTGANCRLLCDYYDTNTVHDLSGNANNGTVTGATAAVHVPLMVPFGSDDYNIYEIAAAGGRIMSSLTGSGGLAHLGGIAGRGGGLAA